MEFPVLLIAVAAAQGQTVLCVVLIVTCERNGSAAMTRRTSKN